ncbi:MAG: hypothetical protein SchgKO_20880 [Schleiferiaceae bacterium]
MKYLLAFLFTILTLQGYSQYTKHIEFFKDTEAYELAKAVSAQDIALIDTLVTQNPKAMEVANPISGDNVLVLAIKLERYKAFSHLLDIGADPNFINPKTQYSVLIEAIRPFGEKGKERVQNEYAKKLLLHGANTNYAVERDIELTGPKMWGWSYATTPLMRASRLDLDMVKTLIQFGADPYKKIEEDQSTAFSVAVNHEQYDIIYYFIDVLKVDVHQPMDIYTEEPSGKKITYYIQDYLSNRYTRARISNNQKELNLLKLNNPNIEKENQSRWELILKLESMGVDFSDGK